MTDNKIVRKRKPMLSAKQVGVAAAFGGIALALVLAGVTIPVPGTPVVTDPKSVFTTIGASLTGPIGGIVIGILAGIAEPGIPITGILAHTIGCIYSAYVYKYFTWKSKDNRVVYLVKWALQVLVLYFIILIPIIIASLFMFYPDPEYSGFFAFLATLEVGGIPEAIFTTTVTVIVLGALPERFRRPMW